MLTTNVCGREPAVTKRGPGQRGVRRGPGAVSVRSLALKKVCREAYVGRLARRPRPRLVFEASRFFVRPERRIEKTPRLKQKHSFF